MAGMNDVPTELVLHIASHLPECCDLAALAATSRGIHRAVNPELYKRDAARSNALRNEHSPQQTALAWGAEHGLPNVARMALAAGSNVDGLFDSPVPMWKREELLRSKQSRGAPVDLLQAGSDEDEVFDSMLVRARERLEHSGSKQLRGLPANLPPERIHSDDHPSYWSSLHLAVYNGHAELISLLLVAGASLDLFSDGLCECPVRLLRLEHQGTSSRYMVSTSSRSTRGLIMHHARTWKPLHIAICRGHDFAVKMLMDAAKAAQLAGFGIVGSGLDDVTENGGRPSHALHIAAFMGNIAVMKTLLDDGVHGADEGQTGEPMDLNIMDEFLMSPLAHALTRQTPNGGENWSAIEWMVQRGADISVVVSGMSLLMWAIGTLGRWSAGIRLLDLAASTVSALPSGCGHILNEVCQQPTPNPTAIESEPEHFRLRLIKRLLELGAHVDHSTHNLGRTPLMQAASLHDLAAMDAFLEAGANPQSKTRHGTTPLLEVCMASEACLASNNGEPSNLEAAIDRLLDAGAEVDCELRDGQTALITICAGGFFPRNDGADRSKTNNSGPTSRAAVIHLLKRGADPNRLAMSQSPTSPMDFAFSQRKLDLCQILLEHGVQLTDDQTARYVDDAVKRCWADGLKFVSKLAKNVCLNHCMERGFFTLLQSAIRAPLNEERDTDDPSYWPVEIWKRQRRERQRRAEDVDYLAALLDLGLDPIDRSSGNTLLHYICGLPKSVSCDSYGYKIPAFKRAVAVWEFLIGRGFDVHARNNMGETPLDIAVKVGNRRLSQFLRAYMRRGRGVVAGESPAREVAVDMDLNGTTSERWPSDLRLC